MLNVTPLVKNGRKLCPMDDHGRVISYPQWGNEKTVDKVETLGELMARVGATSDYPKEWADPDAFIIWHNEPRNAFCGGEVIHAVGIPRNEAYGAGSYGTKTIYISRQKDGSLKIAIPA